MRLREIRLKGFGKFDAGLSLPFDGPGNIHLIVGPNESGKSTLSAAIYGILFGFETMAEEEKRKPWNGEEFWGALYLQDGATEYKIERDFTRNIVTCKIIEGEGRERVVFEGNVSPRGRITDEKEKYAEWLSKLFGFNEPGIFRASLFIHQAELATLKERGEVSRIKQYISGSLETDYDKVTDTLKERYFELTKINPWGRDKSKDRELELARQHLDSTRARIREVQEGLGASQALEQTKDALSAQLEQAREEFIRYGTILDRLREYRKLKQDIAEFKENYDEYERELSRVRNMNKKFKSLSEEYADLTFFEKLPEDFGARATELETMRDSIKDHERRLGDEKQEFLNHPARHITKTVIVSIGFLLAMAVAGFFTGSIAGWLLCVSFGLVVSSALTVRAIWQKAQAIEVRQTIKGRVDLIEEELVTQRKRRDEILAVLRTAVSEEQLLDLDKLKKRHVTFLKIAQQRREVGQVLQSLPDEESLESRYGRAKHELLVKNDQLEKLKSTAGYVETVSHAEEEGYIRKKNTLEAQIRDFEIKLREAEKAFWSTKVSDANLNELEDDLEEAEAEVGRIQLQVDALSIAVTALEEARRRYQDNYMDRFCATISEQFKRITHGRYTRVYWPEGNPDPVVASEAEDKISIDSLSSGTQDQLYFSIRLAIMRYLTSNRSLPLILDDPFIACDANRREEIFKMLEEISRSNQIILFTHDRSYLSWQPAAFDMMALQPANKRAGFLM